ncbi:MAG: hypothetical protein OXK74_06470 [Gemmatimonadota bacterium]|nr:hypothetical protein [Gemmatimonadota bacterium]
MPGVEGLEQVCGLAAPDLAHDDVVGPVAERVAHQVADRDGRVVGGPGLEPEAVGAVDPKFERVLDGDDPLVGGQEFDQRVQERGLARAGAAGDEDVPAGRKGGPGGMERLFRQRAHAHQVLGGERPAPEPADGDGDLGRGGRRADGDPRSVFEPSVQDWLRGGIEPERPGDVDRRAVEPGGGERGRVLRLKFPGSLDPDVAGSVDHDLGDRRVFEQTLQPRKERGEMVHAARALHIRPSSRCRQ